MPALTNATRHHTANSAGAGPSFDIGSVTLTLGNAYLALVEWDDGENVPPTVSSLDGFTLVRQNAHPTTYLNTALFVAAPTSTSTANRTLTFSATHSFGYSIIIDELTGDVAALADIVEQSEVAYGAGVTTLTPTLGVSPSVGNSLWSCATNFGSTITGDADFTVLAEYTGRYGRLLRSQWRSSPGSDTAAEWTWAAQTGAAYVVEVAALAATPGHLADFTAGGSPFTLNQSPSTGNLMVITDA